MKKVLKRYKPKRLNRNALAKRSYRKAWEKAFPKYSFSTDQLVPQMQIRKTVTNPVEDFFNELFPDVKKFSMKKLLESFDTLEVTSFLEYLFSKENTDKYGNKVIIYLPNEKITKFFSECSLKGIPNDYAGITLLDKSYPIKKVETMINSFFESHEKAVIITCTKEVVKANLPELNTLFTLKNPKKLFCRKNS